jgi:ATP-dependent DNA helicase RecQ
MEGRFGKNTILAVVTGSKAKDIVDRDLDRIPTYGALSGTPMETLKALFDELVRAKTILLSPDQYSVASLSPLGREVVWRRESITLKWPSHESPHRGRPLMTEPWGRKSGKKDTRPLNSRDTERVLSAAEESIFEELKEWRKEEASLTGVPAYIVFGNKTLKAIAMARPGSYKELENVPGVGPAKLEAYGDDLLKLIKQLDCK